MQFGELLGVDDVGRGGHQLGRLLRLGERDHVAQRVGAGQEHGEAVQAERDAAVRRRAVAQRLEQEAEAALRLVVRDAEQVEHLGLHVRAVDADGAAADLGSVEHQVVGLAADRARI